MRALMFQSLSQGNNTNCTLIQLAEDNYHDPFSKKADADEAMFRGGRGVSGGKHGKLENFPSLCEIESVLANVVLVLSFIPLKPHHQSVIVRSSLHKGYSSTGLM